jgi:hypothetical protein
MQPADSHGPIVVIPEIVPTDGDPVASNKDIWLSSTIDGRSCSCSCSRVLAIFTRRATTAVRFIGSGSSAGDLARGALETGEGSSGRLVLGDGTRNTT